ncbi:hypothetical protein ANI02nite_12540 [Acetobacter nitrogenifigens DSM 23921 = NBRC 105050]|uniref:Uncharacterized protein n=1 Tax=Acetobacter nitrogenifigens DSM 23921 = NBRC 105050 TaxID=1120919 RepID=A0A511X8U0_9PROT|nr:hypothetical protein ANI02nite_12540 [Acetobacter nitrogenifigens DSM 23921 = NBRC 105050]
MLMNGFSQSDPSWQPPRQSDNSLPGGRFSGANCDLKRLAGGDDFTAVVVSAVAADVVRTLQLAAVSAFSAGFDAKSLVAATHAAT